MQAAPARLYASAVCALSRVAPAVSLYISALGPGLRTHALPLSRRQPTGSRPVLARVAPPRGGHMPPARRRTCSVACRETTSSR